MQLGMVGLGRMGANMVRRLQRGGHDCVAFDRHPENVQAVVDGGRDRRVLARGARREDGQAARGLADDPGGVRRRHARRAAAAPGHRRRRHRRRQLLLPGRPQALGAPRRARHALRRLRHERRRLGPRARLLAHDRRRRRRGRPARADLRVAGARRGGGAAHARPRGRSRTRRGGLAALRTARRGPLREDGPQRHRVRAHGRLRGGPEHPQERERGLPDGRDRRRDGTARPPGALPLRDRRRRRDRGLAARQRHRVLAAGPHRPGARRSRPTSTASPAASRTPARAAGRRSRRSRRACPRRC